MHNPIYILHLNINTNLFRRFIEFEGKEWLQIIKAVQNLADNFVLDLSVSFLLELFARKTQCFNSSSESDGKLSKPWNMHCEWEIDFIVKNIFLIFSSE